MTWATLSGSEVYCSSSLLYHAGQQVCQPSWAGLDRLALLAASLAAGGT